MNYKYKMINTAITSNDKARYSALKCKYSCHFSGRRLIGIPRTENSAAHFLLDEQALAANL